MSTDFDEYKASSYKHGRAGDLRNLRQMAIREGLMNGRQINDPNHYADDYDFYRWVNEDVLAVDWESGRNGLPLSVRHNADLVLSVCTGFGGPGSWFEVAIETPLSFPTAEYSDDDDALSEWEGYGRNRVKVIGVWYLFAWSGRIISKVKGYDELFETLINEYHLLPRDLPDEDNRPRNWDWRR